MKSLPTSHYFSNVKVNRYTITMAQIFTFNNTPINDTTDEYLEKTFNFSLGNNDIDNIPAKFLKINKTLCSCEKINTSKNLDITNFNQVTEICNENCGICRSKLSKTCFCCDSSYVSSRVDDNKNDNYDDENDDYTFSKPKTSESKLKSGSDSESDSESESETASESESDSESKSEHEIESESKSESESESKSESESESKCQVIKSLSCSHQYHYCCIRKWLQTKLICPMCANDWKFIGEEDSSKIRVYYDNIVEEFTIDDNLIKNIGEKFEIDMSLYRITKNKSYMDEYKNGEYSVCTPDVHPSHGAFKLNCIFGSISKSLFIKYATTIKELKELVGTEFNMFPDQVAIIYQGIQVTSDYNTLNVYNIGLKDNSCIQIDKSNQINYTVDIQNDFLVVYPVSDQGNNMLQNMVTGRIAWLGHPYINTDIKSVSCLLSSLYILIKKANTEQDTITSILNNFEKYMEIYQVHKEQTKLALSALESFLTLNNQANLNKNSTIIVCTFYEIIQKILEDCQDKSSSSGSGFALPLSYSNVLCDLLLYSKSPEKINLKYTIKDVYSNKTFNIYSPLVLTNSVPPLLTLNEDLNIVVFTGKGKDVSLPVILFNPLTGLESDVNCAELANKIGDEGSVQMVDDRIYDEGIMVCIDTSNSMSKSSDFLEDIEIKKKDIKDDKKKFYEILETKRTSIPEDDDTRALKNTIIWFITHPNFKDWQKNSDYSQTVDSIALCEQKNLPELATMLVKYSTLFVNLLRNKTVQVGNNNYSCKIKNNDEINEINEINEKYKIEPPPEFLCPITQNIMIKPTIAVDGYSYEMNAITKWLIDHNTSPMTNNKISKTLIPNINLEIIIKEWREKNTDSSESNVNTVTLDLGEKFNNLTFEYNEDTNIWDLIYEIYKITKYSHNMYRVTFSYFNYNSYNLTLVKDVKDKLKFILLNKEIEISLSTYFTSNPSYRKYLVPRTFTGQNIVYKFESGYCISNKYHKYAIWYDLKPTGDNYLTGNIMPLTISVMYYKDSNLCLKRTKKIYSKEKKCMSRLDVVKKMFDAFINRSIAYSFNNSIGLMSFSNESKVECGMTPFYEGFRDKKDSLYTNGATALLEAIDQATDKLVEWKKADIEKRGSAKLRIVCLTDGKNTCYRLRQEDIKRKLLSNDIVLDCIVIGNDYDSYLTSLSNKTGGYIFNPSSIKYAFDIMELETMILSKDRQKLDYGMLNEKLVPPIINPESLNSKSSSIDSILDKYNDSVKVVHKELVLLQKNPHPEIDIYINDDDLYFWKIVINGPDSTPYKNGSWLAYIQFPQNYPLSAPNIRFITPIKHCNINNYGRVCHSILDRNYTPNVGIKTILQCIYGLLLNPDVSDPLDTNLALSFYEANGVYETEIINYVNKHALKTREQWRTELA